MLVVVRDEGGKKKRQDFFLFSSSGSLSRVDAVSYQHLHISDGSIVFISSRSRLKECLIMIAAASSALHRLDIYFFFNSLFASINDLWPYF